MKKIVVTGWVATNSRGRVPSMHTREHPEVKSGFPVVYNNPAKVPLTLTATKVRVTVEPA